MSNKVMRTVYLSPEIDELITFRMGIEDRKRSSLIERMIRKCVEMEKKQDLEVAMAAESALD